MLGSPTRRAVVGARALGWASLGVALAELAAPRQVQSALGIEDTAGHRGILRVLGLRELWHGVGILTAQPRAPQLTAGTWSRVVGDGLDAALLAAAGLRTRQPASFLAVAAAVGVIGLLDLHFAKETSRRLG